MLKIFKRKEERNKIIMCQSKFVKLYIFFNLLFRCNFEEKKNNKKKIR